MGVKKKSRYIFVAVISAVVQFYLSAFIFGVVSRGNVLTATIWNMAIIMFFVALEKLETHLSEKFAKKYADPKNKPSLLKKVLFGYLDGPSIKSALYFFYIAITVCSAIMAADASLFDWLDVNGFPFRDYLQSVRYGILLLIAADKFLDQILKDIKQNQKIS